MTKFEFHQYLLSGGGCVGYIVEKQREGQLGLEFPLRTTATTPVPRTTSTTGYIVVGDKLSLAYG
jgi:hypothetical protein